MICVFLKNGDVMKKQLFIIFCAAPAFLHAVKSPYTTAQKPALDLHDVGDALCLVIEHYIKTVSTNSFLNPKVRSNFVSTLAMLMSQANPSSCSGAAILATVLNHKPELIMFNIDNFITYLQSLSLRNGKYKSYVDDIMDQEKELRQLQDQVIDNLDCKFFAPRKNGFRFAFDAPSTQADGFILSIEPDTDFFVDSNYQYAPIALLYKHFTCRFWYEHKKHYYTKANMRSLSNSTLSNVDFAKPISTIIQKTPAGSTVALGWSST